jgi:hypothetical protein
MQNNQKNDEHATEWHGRSDALGAERILTKCSATVVRLVICESRDDLKVAANEMLSETWQRCREHVNRSAILTAPFLTQRFPFDTQNIRVRMKLIPDPPQNSARLTISALNPAFSQARV